MSNPNAIRTRFYDILRTLRVKGEITHREFRMMRCIVDSGVDNLFKEAEK